MSQPDLEELIENFALFSDWEERYKYLIDLGKALPPMADSLKNENTLVKGCTSQVWMICETNAAGQYHFTADSDAIITKGIIAILVRTFSGQPPEEIINADTAYIDEIGLKEHLSPTRANGLVSMIKQIKLYAVAYQAQLS